MRPKKDFENTDLFARMVAQKQGWKLNPDREFYGMLIEGLAKNYNRYGYFLCPCRDTEGSREEDDDVICPCAYARPDIAEHGHCYCSLYLSPEFSASGQATRAIPERRYRDKKG
jgi:ferredoxin-thioredoxin reductase catalytic chain